MSKFSKILSSVSSVLGLSQKAPTINIPAAELPPVPAPTAITDTGATVALGSAGDVKNQRVSGRSLARSKTNTVDILGGLGQNGLNI